MNTLTIDIGNQRSKTELWHDEECEWSEAVEEISAKHTLDIIKRNKVEGVIVSSVKKEATPFIDEIKEKAGCLVCIFNEKEIAHYSDKIAYQGSIGADRIAAFLGAIAVFKDIPLLLVDMGTAITIDVVDSRSNYRGGNISLGFSSRLKALAKAASLLPEAKEFHNREGFGTDTFSAIENGAVNGIIGEVVYSYSLAKNAFGVETILMTGGDEKYFTPALKKYAPVVISDPCLVGRGLNFHLRKVMEETGID